MLDCWLREKKYVDDADDDETVLKTAQATFLSAVVLEEGYVKNVPESHEEETRRHAHDRVARMLVHWMKEHALHRFIRGDKAASSSGLTSSRSSPRV